MRGRSIIAMALVFMALSSVAQTKTQIEAPLPGQLIAAKKVFISNGGDYPGFGFEPGRSYGQFYEAMKDWGRYELVASPSEADLVCEIALIPEMKLDYQVILSQLKLDILDPKTGIRLWNFAEELETHGVVGRHRDEKFKDAMGRIVGDLKILVPSSTTGARH